MRKVLPLAALALLTNCGRQDFTKPGWHYNRAAMGLGYGAAGKGGLADPFLGVQCESNIVFGVIHGSYGDQVRSFTVTAGSWHKTYAAFHSVEGRALLFPDRYPSSDGDRLAAGLAAGQGIVIRTDDGWNMTVPGDPIVGQFVKDCGAVNAKRQALAHH